MRPGRGASWSLAWALLLGACAEPGPLDTSGPRGAPELPQAAPRLPEGEGDGTPFFPARVRAPRGTGSLLADVDGCAECHTDAFAQWRSSAHAFASFDDPVYRVAVERLRAQKGNRPSRMCAGCHDVALLVDDAMDVAVRPEDPRAHAGVSCRVCHGISSTRADGNGSFDLDTSPVPIPRDGDPATLAAHKKAVARPILRESDLCISCHRSFLDGSTGNAHHIVGQDDATPWRRSVFAGSEGERIDERIDEADCRACHMPREAAPGGDPGAKHGTLASHAFLGGHTWLAANEPKLAARAQKFLQESVFVEVSQVDGAGGGTQLVSNDPIVIRGGEHLVVDVVVKNERVGHKFPGGVADAQDTWLEVRVKDASGKLVASAGDEHARTSRDPTAHRFLSFVVGADGEERRLRQTAEFVTAAYQSTIPPRDASVVRYAFDVPEGVELPLEIEATLMHRTRNLDLARAACDDSRTDRGRAFARETPKKRGRAFDPCEPMPVTPLSTSRARLGLGPALVSRRPAFERVFALAQGLSHALGEHLDRAREPIAEALRVARTERERAMAFGLLAALEAKQGRTFATFVAARNAEDALGAPHPATARARAGALLAEWKWEAAAAELESAATRAPNDDALLAELGIAWGGVGEYDRALSATARGLLLQPRDADLLRVQALALRALRAEPSLLARADDAFLACRVPDLAASTRAACSARVAGCAHGRVPVHTIVMRALPR